MSSLRPYAEAPTAASSLPPPPDELRQIDRLAMIGRLGAGIMRELLDQLSLVSERAEALTDGEVGRDETRANARVILEKVERMASQARRLLSFAEQRVFERDVVEVSCLVEGTVALLAPAALLRGVAVSAVPARENLHAELDRRQMTQAVVSLLRSSVQACRLGGTVIASVSLGRDDERDVICIEIADDGAPFRPEDRLRLFEPFASASQDEEGTGLGLCVAETIVRDHGGAIEVDCGSDGKRFHLRLPRRILVP